MRKTLVTLTLTLALAAKFTIGCGNPHIEEEEFFDLQEFPSQTPVEVEDIREEGEIPLAPIRCFEVYNTGAEGQIIGTQLNAQGNLAWTEGVFYRSTESETIWKEKETVWYRDAEKMVRVQGFQCQNKEIIFDVLPLLSERFLSFSLFSSNTYRIANFFYDSQQHQVHATNLKTVIAEENDIFVAPIIKTSLTDIIDVDVTNGSSGDTPRFTLYNAQTRSTENICPLPVDEGYQPLPTLDLALSGNLLYFPSVHLEEGTLALHLCDIHTGGQLALPMPEEFTQLAVENSRVVYLRPLTDLNIPLYGWLRTVNLDALASENFFVNGEERPFLYVFRNLENSSEIISFSQLQLSGNYVVFTSCENALLTEVCEGENMEERIAVYGYDFSQRRLERISPFWHQPHGTRYDVAGVADNGKRITYVARGEREERLYLCEKE